MSLSREDLERLAADVGFQPAVLDKVLRLLSLLEALRGHPYLGPRLALKGGTALNLFVLDLPRLSVDIDLNYVGALERETMLAERPVLEQAVRAVCSREGLALRRSPGDFAGGKWRLQYEQAAGGPSALELDLNFLLRQPLWPPVVRDSLSFGPWSARGISVVDEHELAAGKLTALLSRQTSRDVFDAHAVLGLGRLQPERLRLAFVVYGAASRRDWRSVTPGDVAMEPRDADQRLLPLVRRDLVPTRRELDAWCARLVSECRARLSVVLPFTEAEHEFLERINARGEIAPELLTGHAGLQERIRSSPALRWKALNVQRSLGRGDGTGLADAVHESAAEPWL
jgi:predicted nucleotidyltransferase component of viral defense system